MPIHCQGHQGNQGHETAQRSERIPAEQAPQVAQATRATRAIHRGQDRMEYQEGSQALALHRACCLVAYLDRFPVAYQVKACFQAIDQGQGQALGQALALVQAVVRFPDLYRAVGLAVESHQGQEREARASPVPCWESWDRVRSVVPLVWFQDE